MSSQKGVPGQIPQTQSLAPGEQVRGRAGGFVWEVQPEDQLRRYLCLGVQGGTYYASEQEHREENLGCLDNMIAQGNGTRAVEIVRNISVDGRAARQDPTLTVLASLCRQTKCKQTKQAAYAIVPEVCRIPTFLFQFVQKCEDISQDGSGWGRAHRRAIANWYLQHHGDEDNVARGTKHVTNTGSKNDTAMETEEGTPAIANQPTGMETEDGTSRSSKKTTAMQLAMHVTKYKQRDGWSHQDLLRLAHPSAKSTEVQIVLSYIIKGLKGTKALFLKDESTNKTNELFNFLQGVEDMKTVKDPNECVSLIVKHNLVREHIPTQFLTSNEVWMALLVKMPMTAMIRNLGKMTSMGLLDRGKEGANLVIRKLANENAIKSSRVHPFIILVAMKIYSQGKGDKGSLSWSPNQDIITALDEAFYKAFKNVEPTGKRFCLALDVSSSMTWGGCIGCPLLNPRNASAAMAMITLRTEPNCEIVGFSHDMVHIPITKEMKLDEVVTCIGKVPMGGTDCGASIIWANKQRKKFDVFIVYTDNETYSGHIHPSAAVKEYRQKMDIPNAKLIVCGMTANKFTIADPYDRFMFDMAGFDTAAPEIIRNFAMEMF